MNVKILTITLLLLSTFASSQTVTTKVAFQNIRDSCNKEIGMQYQRKDYDGACLLYTSDAADE